MSDRLLLSVTTMSVETSRQCQWMAVAPPAVWAVLQGQSTTVARLAVAAAGCLSVAAAGAGK